jgi:hypothetical protein
MVIPTMSRFSALLLIAYLVHHDEASHGEEHSNDDLTPSTQIEREDYQHKEKLAGVAGLKDKLQHFPDITGQTQREGTLKEHIINPPISKNEYWSRTCESIFNRCIIFRNQ